MPTQTDVKLKFKPLSKKVVAATLQFSLSCIFLREGKATWVQLPPLRKTHTSHSSHRLFSSLSFFTLFSFYLNPIFFFLIYRSDLQKKNKKTSCSPPYLFAPVIFSVAFLPFFLVLSHALSRSFSHSTNECAHVTFFTFPESLHIYRSSFLSPPLSSSLSRTLSVSVCLHLSPCINTDVYRCDAGLQLLSRIIVPQNK